MNGYFLVMIFLLDGFLLLHIAFFFKVFNFIFCMYMYTYVWLCVCVVCTLGGKCIYVSVCMWQSKVSIRCHS